MHSLDDIDRMVECLAPQVLRGGSGQITIRIGDDTETMRVELMADRSARESLGLHGVSALVRYEVEYLVGQKRRELQC